MTRMLHDKLARSPGALGLAVLVGVTLWCHVPAARAAPGKPAVSAGDVRATFARALRTVRPGMTAADVRQKLGPPDDIKTEADPGGISAARTVEVWRYGTHGHGTFATLGTVHLQADHRVQYVFGGTGQPPVGFVEADLRRVLDVIDAVPSYNASFEPQRLIAAVNALVPLGKDRALAAIDEYLRVSSPFEDHGREGVFLLDRALFDLPPSGVMPAMHVGAGRTIADPKRVPRLPLVIIDDLPLEIDGPYELGGLPEPPEEDVAWFRAHGTLRKVPMVPPARPLEVVDAYVNGPLGKLIVVDDSVRAVLYDQALRLVGTAYRPNGDWFSTSPKLATAWAKVRADVATVAPKWSAAAIDQYTRADGTTLPPVVTSWQRVWWDVELAPKRRARVTFERVSDHRVDVLVGSSFVAGRIRIVDASGARISEIDVRTGGLGSYVIEVPLHTKLRPTFERDGKILAGPELTP